MQIAISHHKALIVPRLSEKSNQMSAQNKYVFKVEGKINKVELRKAVEKAYGTKVARVNMITVKGKQRRSGRTLGKTSGFKKAIITLAPGSKKIDTFESK